jgi:hypothetical protein
MPLPLFDSILRATIQPCLVLTLSSVEDGGPLEDEAPTLPVDTIALAIAPLCEVCRLLGVVYTP